MWQKSGFTLIELVMLIVITGAISLVVFHGFAKTVEVYIAVEGETKASQEIWITLERIARELRSAEQVIEPQVGASSNKLVFSKPTEVVCSECVDQSKNVTFEFVTADKKLVRETSGAGEKIMNYAVEDFTVSAENKNGQTIYVISLTKQVAGRSVSGQTAVRALGASSAWVEVVQ